MDTPLTLLLFVLVVLLFWCSFLTSLWASRRYCAHRLLSAIVHDVSAVLPNVPSSKQNTKGIVTCAGGPAYLAEAFASLKILRRTGCTLPVEIYYVGSQEVSEHDIRKFRREFGDSVQFVDATVPDLGVTPYNLQGFEIKPYALLLTRFDDILFLDSDCAPVKNPEYLFDVPEYVEYGNMFWPDYSVHSNLIRPRGITDKAQFPKGFETESGQFVVNKSKCLLGLVYSWILNKHQSFFYTLYYGDKDLFRLGFVLADQPFYQVPFPTGMLGIRLESGRPLHCAMPQKCPVDGTGIVFVHRTMHKRLRQLEIMPGWDVYVSNDGEDGTRTTINWVGYNNGTSLADKEVVPTTPQLQAMCQDITRWYDTYRNVE